MMDSLKIGLIGAGVFASYHANKLAKHTRVDFTGIVDRDETKARDLAKQHGVRSMSLPELLTQSDAIVIATPAKTHGDFATQALKAGCHCLIEKPLTISAKNADEIIALAAAKNLKIQVGHQERLVAREIGLMGLSERPIKIEAVRNSTYSARGTDTSVTMDLMTHDIDLCTAILGGVPDKIQGRVEGIKSNTPDRSAATLIYDGCRVSLAASRVESTSKRVMKITYPSGFVEVDFNAKLLTHTTPFNLNADFAGDPRAKDSLGEATDIFVRAILDKTPVLVTAEEGAIAVLTALQIDEVFNRGT